MARDDMNNAAQSGLPSILVNVMKPFIIIIMALAAAASGSAAAGAAQPILWAALHEPGNGGWHTSLAVSPHDRSRVLAGGDILGIALSLDAGDSWVGTYGLRCFNIAEFTWHPTDSNIVWVGTEGGPYQSTNGGRDWISRRTGMPPIAGWSWSFPTLKILFDPNNPARLLAFGGNHLVFSSTNPEYGEVYESTNSGANWRRLGTVHDGSAILEAAFAPGSSTMLYAASRDYGVSVSQDGGATWQLRTNGLPSERVRDLVVHPTNRLVAYVAMDNRRISVDPDVYAAGGIWMTTDGGTNWAPKNSGLEGLYITDPNANVVPRFLSISVSRVNPNRLVTSDARWGGRLYVSDNGGESWRRCYAISIPMSGDTGVTGVEFDPADADTIFVFDGSDGFRSRDGGYTWEDIYCKTVPGQPGYRGRGYSGWVTTRYAWHPTDPQRSIFSGFDHGYAWQSRNGLRTWIWPSYFHPGPWGGAMDIAWGPNDSIYMAFGQNEWVEHKGVGRSLDGGVTYTSLEGTNRGLPTVDYPRSVYPRPDVPGEVWVCWSGLRHSTDYGENWSTVLSNESRWIAADPNDPQRIFVGATNGVYQSTSGVTFQLMPGSPRDTTRLTVDTAGRLFAVNWRQNGGLYRFATNRWTQLRSDQYTRGVAVDPRNPRRLMAVTCDDPYHDETYASGVWTSEDDGRTWRQQNLGLPHLHCMCVSVSPHDPDLWIVGTGGRGFFITRWADLSICREGASVPPRWRVLGTPNLEAVVEHSTDLRQWHPFATNTLSMDGGVFDPGSEPHEFFRAKVTW